MVSGRLMGCLMKNAIVTNCMPHGCYVLRIDGRLNSTYRRFVDAVRAGLQLKDQFPQHDIKVSVAQTRASTEEIKRHAALH
jgi:hypothetical protein